MEILTLFKINRKKYILELVLLSLIFFTLFVPSKFTKIILAILLVIYTIITTKLLNGTEKLSTNKKKVILLMLMFGAIYVIVYYILGLYFGYYNNPLQFGFNTIIKYILPFTITIISSEILRNRFVEEKDKISNILITVIMVLIELVLYSQIYDLSKLNDFLTVLGLIVFASISCNLLYNYICVRFGYKSIIIYRLITVLFLYIIPIIPNVPTFFRTTLRIIYPYIIYLVFEYMFSKEKVVISKNNKKVKIINSIIVIFIGILLTMLISCNFYVGILAIGSESMTGTYDKGDAVVFTEFKNQNINTDDVILFKQNQQIIVHRVVEIEMNNNQKIYYTQGDKNNTRDEGFITNSDIIGICKFGIKYIGYPSLWLSDIFGY